MKTAMARAEAETALPAIGGPRLVSHGQIAAPIEKKTFTLKPRPFGSVFDLSEPFDYLTGGTDRTLSIEWQAGNVVRVELDRRQWENWQAWRRRHQPAMERVQVRVLARGESADGVGHEAV